MRWHALYDLMKIPLEVLFIGFILLGAGNLLSSGAFADLYSITGFAATLGRIFLRTGQFIVNLFPLFVLLRAVYKKEDGAVTSAAALSGYAAFLIVTMVLNDGSLPSSAYSSIMGLSLSQTETYASGTVTKYPLQTGMVGSLVCALIVRRVFIRKKKKNAYGQVSREGAVLAASIFWCGLAGALAVVLWPYFVRFTESLTAWIGIHKAAPGGQAVYALMDCFYMVLGLGALYRYPLWYGDAGGTWTSVNGTVYTGDASIWTAQTDAGSITAGTGSLFSIYYILALFAIPAVILSVYVLMNGREDRRRYRGIVLLAMLASMFCGSVLPIVYILLFLCPLLFFMHAGMTALTAAVLAGFEVNLGYYAVNTMTTSALPGTFLELILYGRTEMYRDSVIGIVIIGLCAAVLWFLMTRLYFKYLALDLSRSGRNKTYVDAVVKACGNVMNIRSVHSTHVSLTIGLYDNTMFDAAALEPLGGVHAEEREDSVLLLTGACSTMIRLEIRKRIRDTVRDI